jgi:hypothetical protein
MMGFDKKVLSRIEKVSKHYSLGLKSLYAREGFLTIMRTERNLRFSGKIRPSGQI